MDLYPDEDIAEILRAASVEAPPDFGHQIRIWEVIVLGMIAYQQDRRARENNSRAKKSRTPKEKTAARDALDDLESKLKAAAEALRELPMLAEETMLKERMLGRDRLRLELLTGIDHVQKAKKQIAVQGGGPQGQPVLNGAITLLMGVCEHATGRKIQASRNNWFVAIAGRLLEPLFPELARDAKVLDTRISRLAAGRT